MERKLLEINLSAIEWHLFNGGWKIHHIVKDEDFMPAEQWDGYKIFTLEGGSHSVITDEIITQNIEILPANRSDLHYWRINIDGKLAVERRRFSTDGDNLLNWLMKNEGLYPYEFFTKFNLHAENMKYFSGKIIQLTPFRYNL